MAKAPLFFDPGEVTVAILLFDDLGGPLLFEDWEEVSQNEGMLALKEIRYFYDHLPDSLTRLERLSLKPLLLLTNLEHTELVAIRGGSVNPLQYKNKESVGPLAFCGHAVKINDNRHSRFDRPATGIGVKSKGHASRSKHWDAQRVNACKRDMEEGRSSAAQVSGVEAPGCQRGSDIDVDSDMGAEENSVGDIDENFESVVDMESMVDSEEDGSCMVDDEWLLLVALLLSTVPG
ncbi:hypothetical protein C8F04DRAFT_1195335 [Mycena alexandri]|uniref:Uncharacterized protein n=1 Tax=Mycena alexandri TaxID=1745969 RepID=A0AAD6S640_9AGAR|nr:hypothetical protein C8F04DRAFT_1195335 [Mycena alexandri]